MASSRIVNIVSGILRDEVSQRILGRWPEAKDGTWKWIIEESGKSRLVPIATVLDRPTTIHIPKEGLYELRPERVH